MRAELVGGPFDGEQLEIRHAGPRLLVPVSGSGFDAMEFRRIEDGLDGRARFAYVRTRVIPAPSIAARGDHGDTFRAWLRGLFGKSSW